MTDTQQPLFDPRSESELRTAEAWAKFLGPPPGQWDVPSVEAGQVIIGARAKQHARLLEWLALAGPSTDEQAAEGAGIGPNSIRARRGELVELGLIYKVDTEGTTAAGNRATRWAVVD